VNIFRSYNEARRPFLGVGENREHKERAYPTDARRLSNGQHRRTSFTCNSRDNYLSGQELLTAKAHRTFGSQANKGRKKIEKKREEDAKYGASHLSSSSSLMRFRG
jgi:hypothetical protein